MIKTEEFRVVYPNGKVNFEECEKCKHSEDTIEHCILRQCVHAINALYERYEPKEESK